MGKIKTKSLKSSMTATFLITICVIAVLSAITILASNLLQQEILKKRCFNHGHLITGINSEL